MLIVGAGGEDSGYLYVTFPNDDCKWAMTLTGLLMVWHFFCLTIEKEFLVLNF